MPRTALNGRGPTPRGAPTTENATAVEPDLDVLGRRAFQAVDRAADALEALRAALQASGRDKWPSPVAGPQQALDHDG